jgi:hypothetical protein
MVNTGKANDTSGGLNSLRAILGGGPTPDAVSLAAGAAGFKAAILTQDQTERSAFSGRPKASPQGFVTIPDFGAGKVEPVAQAGGGNGDFWLQLSNKWRAGRSFAAVMRDQKNLVSAQTFHDQAAFNGF